MGYWLYYLAFIAFFWVLEHPAILLGIVVFFALRRFIPDPWIWLKTMGRLRALQAQIETNPANVTARRDLARIHLARRRAREAARLLDEARVRDPESAELLYLSGLARWRLGEPERALEHLVEAVAEDPRVSFGEAYLVAGDALRALGRKEEAVDAYEHYVEVNSSSVQGWAKLAIAHRDHGEKEEAREALSEARRTFGQIPGYRRRQELGWYLRAQVLGFFV